MADFFAIRVFLVFNACVTFLLAIIFCPPGILDSALLSAWVVSPHLVLIWILRATQQSSDRHATGLRVLAMAASVVGTAFLAYWALVPISSPNTFAVCFSPLFQLSVWLIGQSLVPNRRDN